MKAYLGEELIIKLGASDEEPEIIGGLRTTDMLLHNDIVETTHVESDGFRTLLDGAGTQSLKISAEGLYTDTKAEQKLMKLAFARKSERYCLCFGNGFVIDGSFIVSSYVRSGDHESEELYEITLESTGPFRGR